MFSQLITLLLEDLDFYKLAVVQDLLLLQSFLGLLALYFILLQELAKLDQLDLDLYITSTYILFDVLEGILVPMNY